MSVNVDFQIPQSFATHFFNIHAKILYLVHPPQQSVEFL